MATTHGTCSMTVDERKATQLFRDQLAADLIIAAAKVIDLPYGSAANFNALFQARLLVRELREVDSALEQNVLLF